MNIALLMAAEAVALVALFLAYLTWSQRQDRAHRDRLINAVIAGGDPTAMARLEQQRLHPPTPKTPAPPRPPAIGGD